jgi:hypothetical protein
MPQAACADPLRLLVLSLARSPQLLQRISQVGFPIEANNQTLDRFRLYHHFSLQYRFSAHDERANQHHFDHRGRGPATTD